jgi:3-oxoacyl-[acyl-carrier-protein] synthase II
MDQIVVSGVGMATALGAGREATWEALLAKRRGMAPLRLFELPGCPIDVAAQVDDASLELTLPAGEQGWSRCDRMATWAAREALEHAGVVSTAECELFVAGTTAGMFENEELLAALSRDPTASVDSAYVYAHALSAPADRVHRMLGPFRAVRSVCSACSGGANAIVLAAAALLSGRVETVLAGGADALCRLSYAGFAALGALDPAPCRPFDASRAGLNLGEGAAFVVLELERTARARGVTPIAALGGWATAAEAHHATRPEPRGVTAARTIVRALERAKLSPADVDYVSAHGTATPANDPMEALALSKALGEEVARIAVSSSKGQLGHTLGAAGAIEAAIAALAVQRDLIPPTVGLIDVDSRCRSLNLPTEPQEREVRAALSNAFGFGGTDTVLLLSKLARQPTAAVAQPASVERRRVVITGGASFGPLGVNTLADAAVYAEPGERPADEPLDAELVELDPLRARRMGRASRLVTAAVARALDDAGIDPAAHRARLGIVVGSAFGSVAGTAAFLQRVFEKGARFAPPAQFPGVLPSALPTAASIYLGLQGPAMSVADLATSAEAALLCSVELIACGEADMIAACGVEEHSVAATHVSSPMCSFIEDRGHRGEGAAVLLLEDEQRARERGATARAWLQHCISWRGDAVCPALPEAPERAAVFLAREGAEQPVLPNAWATRPTHVVGVRAGDHECAGGFAMLAAASAVADGRLDSALSIGGGPDRRYVVMWSTIPPTTSNRPQ